MKRLIALTLALVSIFALCAFGVPATAAAAPAPVLEDEAIAEVEEETEVSDEYAQFKDILDALVAGEYDKAHALIEELRPETEKREIVEIKITKDNFLDYFQYTSDFKPARYIEKNSKGKVVGFYLNPGYALKDEYQVAFDQEHESKVEVGVKYKVKFYYPVKKNVDIDFDKLTYKVTGKAKQTDSVDEMRDGWHYYDEDGKTNTFFIGLSHSTYMTNKKDYWAQAVPKKDVTLVSASGTLYVYADSIPEPAPEAAPETAPEAAAETAPETAPEAAPEPAPEG